MSTVKRTCAPGAFDLGEWRVDPASGTIRSSTTCRRIDPRALMIFLTVLALSTPLSAQSIDQANELFADKRWDDSAEIFRAITQSDPENGAGWYGLARASHEGGHLEQARGAYRRAVALRENPARARFHFARLHASQGNKQESIRLLREAQEGGMTAFRVVLQTPEFATLKDDSEFQAIIEKMKPCVTAEYRFFDFWIGEWEVTTPQGQPAGASRISKTQGGCVLLEEWTSSSGGTGTSFNTYNTQKQSWQQFWVDAQGTVLEISGGLVEGAMVMTSDRDQTPIQRITWTPNDDGSVRQHWESSSDGGQSWSTAFDGIYRRVKS